MLKNSPNQQLMQQILGLMPHFCDRCGSRHDRADLELMTADPEKVVCKLECNNCKNVYLFHVNTLTDGVLNTKRASIKSDVNGDEMRRFSQAEQIENDEVLEVFSDIKEVSSISDFESLFN